MVNANANRKRNNNDDLLDVLTEDKRDSRFVCDEPSNGESNDADGERECKRKLDDDGDLLRAPTYGERDNRLSCGGNSNNESSDADSERGRGGDGGLLRLSTDGERKSVWLAVDTRTAGQGTSMMTANARVLPACSGNPKIVSAEHNSAGWRA